MKARRKRLWRKYRREQAYTKSTPAPPAGDVDTVSAPHSLTLADTLPPFPRSCDAQSQEVLESVSQADAQFLDHLKHVDMESAGVASFYDEDDANDSDFGDLTQLKLRSEHSSTEHQVRMPGRI